jgi:hypothetical protein
VKGFLILRFEHAGTEFGVAKNEKQDSDVLLFFELRNNATNHGFLLFEQSIFKTFTDEFYFSEQRLLV